MTISPNFTPWVSLLGGLLIGLATTIFLLFLGRVAGISGLLRTSITAPSGDKLWRVLFIVGLLIGGGIISLLAPEMTAKVHDLSTIKVVTAAILVGAGTTIGSGCTSGHGICGLSRFSIRSLIATLTFMGAGMVTVYLMGA